MRNELTESGDVMAAGLVLRSTVAHLQSAGLRIALCVAAVGATFAVLAPVDGAQAAITYTKTSLGYIGNQPYGVAIGDLDGDGKPDIATANHWDKQVGILTRNAAGTGWDGPVAAGTLAYGPYAVAIGDLNADGKPDLAMANAGNGTAESRMSVIMRNAAGTGWDAPEMLGQTGYVPTDVQIGDMNGDGKPDLVSADASSGTVTVITRNSAGTGWDAPVTSGAGNGTHSVAVGDFNADGKLDVALPSANEAKVTVLTRNSAGTGWNAGVDISVGIFPASIVTADLNGDGKLDLATANANSNTVSVITRKTDNTGWNAAASIATTGSGPYGLAVGDLDGDGKPDLATSNINSNDVTVITRNTAGTGWNAAVTAGATDADPRSLAIGDVTGDGRPDVVTVNLDDNTATQLTAVYDNGPPTTTDDVDGAWHPAPVAVTLTATDDVGGSGVDETYYTTGASPATPTTASAEYDPAAKPVLADGEQIKYFSVDKVGGAEAVKTSAAAKVDLAAPATTDDVDGSAWHPAPVTVTLTAVDAQSGVDATYYTVGTTPATPTAASAEYDPASKPILDDGERISYFSVDEVGHAEAVMTSDPAKVDARTPDTSIGAAPADPGSDKRPPVTFSTTAPDATFECSVDDDAWEPCTSPDRPAADLADGAHTFAVRTISRAGIPDDSPAVASFTVDTAIPEVPVLLGGPPPAGTSTSASIAFSTEPAATATCEVDGGAPAACTSPLTLTGLSIGRHVVVVRQRDAAGNQSGPLTVAFEIVAPAVIPPRTDPPTSVSAELGSAPDRAGRYPVIVRDGSGSLGCRADTGVLASCAVAATSITALKASPSRLAEGTLLARGSSAPGVSASRSLAATLTLTRQGRRALARRPLGITARLTVTSRTTDGKELRSTARVRLQSANRLILPVSGHRTSLSMPIKQMLARMVRTVTAAKTVRCVADTDRHGTPASDRALTRTQARIACAYLRARGIDARVSSSGNGHQRPRAPNGTDRGRKLNRRLTITTTY